MDVNLLEEFVSWVAGPGNGVEALSGKRAEVWAQAFAAHVSRVADIDISVSPRCMAAIMAAAGLVRERVGISGGRQVTRWYATRQMRGCI